MEILVNHEPLDFKLENESSVGEIVDGLAHWLSAGRFAITAIDVNATSYALHDRESWADIQIDDVDRLAVEALPLTDVDHATLVALEEYFSILAECLETRNELPLGELVRELPYVRARLTQFFPALASEDGETSVLLDDRLEQGKMPHPENARSLSAEVNDIRTIIRSREREYREPARELALTLGHLSATRPALIEVPVQLQTGKEQEAMQTVVTLTELLTRVVRLVPLVERSEDDADINVEGVRRFAEELLPHLIELKDALEIQDTVLIGDLLEYEVAPRLEALHRLLPGGTQEQ
ncbi:MAG: hypothetical protein ACOC2Y_04370 [Spirochaetota bacterium]